MKPDRRRFLSRLVGGIGAGTVPVKLLADDRTRWSGLARAAESVPRGRSMDEEFWRLVRDQFSLRDGLIMMNAANLCPAPMIVSHTVERLTRDVNSDASFQNRAKFNALREEGRRLIAAYVGADPDEIAINRNTSEGNNTIVNGLALQSGDQVAIWDQNHPTNNLSWEVRGERVGFTVKRISTPERPGSRAELVEVFAGALTPRTRVLAFSHVSNVSGVRVPAKEICALARARGVVTLVDGAQAFGVLPLDLHDMGCDFYTGSSHKWFLGPKEAGVLYVRRDRIADVWASNVGVGWQAALNNGAQKFDNLGQRDDACVAAMGTAARFHQTIGRERIDARVREIVSALATGLEQRVPGIRFTNPRDPDLSAGVLIFVPPRGDVRQMYETLYREHQIAGAPRGPGIRLSPHVFNTMDQVDRVVAAVADLVT